MAKNTSFNHFGSFSKLMNNPVATADMYDTNVLANTMTAENQTFLDDQAKYNDWAKVTLLSDSISPLTGIKFSQLFALEIGEHGQNVVVFNPAGDKGTSWSKNESGLVNALLAGFGTQRYSVLLHGLHERAFDHSNVIEHNVRTSFNQEEQRWIRWNWSNRRFVQDTPNPKSSEGVSWISKHTELDRLILAVIGHKSIRYNFFDEIAWNRFQTNVLDNMNSLVVDVVTMIGNFAQGARDLREVKREQQRNGVSVAVPSAVIVDNIDVKTLTAPFKITVKMNWADRNITRVVNPNDSQGIAYVANALADPNCVEVHLVK